MSKMQEAFEKHCNGDEEYFDEVSFNAGYQAAIADVKAGGPAAVGQFHMGRYICIGAADLKENQPAWIQKDWADADKLYKLPEDV